MLSSRRTRNTLGMLVGISISTAAAWLAFRGADLGAVVDSLKEANWYFVAFSAVLLMLANWLRAVRWAQLLGENIRSGSLVLLGPLMIGYFANLVIPLRAGEAVRIAVAVRRTGASAGRITASVLIERVLDVISLFILFAIGSLSVDLPSYVYWLTYTALGVAIVGLVLALVVSSYSEKISEMLLRWGNTKRPSIGRLVSFVETTIRGFSTVRDRKSMTLAMLISFGIRFAEMGSLYFAIAAIGISISAVASALVNGLVTLGLTIPTGPAAIGSQELLTKIGLEAYGFSGEGVLAAAVSNHIVGIGVTLIVGAIFSIAIGGVWLRSLVSTDGNQ